MLTLASNRLPAPICACSPTTQFGPIYALAATTAPACITAPGATCAPASTCAAGSSQALSATPGSISSAGANRLAIRAYRTYGSAASSAGTGQAAASASCSITAAAWVPARYRRYLGLARKAICPEPASCQVPTPVIVHAPSPCNVAPKRDASSARRYGIRLL